MKLTKHAAPAALLLMALAVMGACKGRNDRSLEATPAIVDDTATYPDSIQRTQNFEYTDTLTWRGEPCRFVITRRAEDSLPRIEDSHHIHYVDNSIALKVERAGRVIFNHTFTKRDFNHLIDDEFRKSGILTGVMFDKVKNGNLLFAASVSDPTMDDLYQPFVITIAPGGAMQIERDANPDMGAPEPDDAGD